MVFPKRMAENRFAKISAADTENIKASAIPSKTKEATKYGVKLFKGKKNPLLRVFNNLFYQ